MKKYALAVALALTATAANAADLLKPAAAPSAPAPIVEVEKNPFAGAYIGVHAGYSQLTDEDSFNGWSGGGQVGYSQLTDEDSFNGWSGGGQVGFNTALGNGFIAGIELDGSLSGANFKAADDEYAIKIGNDWLVSARGRIGYVIGGVMPYATAGVAWAKFSGRETDLVLDETSSLNDTVRLWVIGGGVDYAIPSTNLVAGVGVLHYFEDGIDNVLTTVRAWLSVKLN